MGIFSKLLPLTLQKLPTVHEVATGIMLVGLFQLHTGYILCGVESWGKPIWPYQCPKLGFLYPPTIPPRVLWVRNFPYFQPSTVSSWYISRPPCGKALHADQADAARLSPEQRKDLQRRLAEWTEVRTPKRNKKAEMKQSKIPLAWNTVDDWNPAPPAIYETL